MWGKCVEILYRVLLEGEIVSGRGMGVVKWFGGVGEGEVGLIGEGGMRWVKRRSDTC